MAPGMPRLAENTIDCNQYLLSMEDVCQIFSLSTLTCTHPLIYRSFDVTQTGGCDMKDS